MLGQVPTCVPTRYRVFGVVCTQNRLEVGDSKAGNYPYSLTELRSTYLRVWASWVVVLHVRSRSVEAEQAMLQRHELEVLVEYLGDHVNASLRQGFSRQELHQRALELARQVDEQIAAPKAVVTSIQAMDASVSHCRPCGRVSGCINL